MRKQDWSPRDPDYIRRPFGQGASGIGPSAGFRFIETPYPPVVFHFLSITGSLGPVASVFCNVTPMPTNEEDHAAPADL